MNEEQTAITTAVRERTIGELFLQPFGPIAIVRPLGPYGRLLGLKPATPATPDPDFLFALLTGVPSHQVLLRHSTGGAYKNLEHLLRGRHTASATTLALLSERTGLSTEDLESWAGISPSGPLLPTLLNVFLLVEGIPRHIAGTLFATPLPCPCCGKNRLNDVDVWWEAHHGGLGVAEYRFADRLLMALVGANVVEALWCNLTPDAVCGLAGFADLCRPGRYPMGNWLLEMQQAAGCTTFAEFAVKLQLAGVSEEPVTHGRLRKWSAGQDVLPLPVGKAIARAFAMDTIGSRRLIVARVFSVLTEFAEAASPSACSRADAQRLVWGRTKAIQAKMAQVFYRNRKMDGPSPAQ